jgi:hypothetical protein
MQTPPMPGMMPSQSGPKPGLTAFVPALTAGYDTEELTKMLFDPRSPVPANRVLAAIIEQQKNFATKKAVANELAMRQNAAQQGTIADEVVAQARRQLQPQAAPVMAAHGGEMHSYAGGGAVAFQSGGNPEIERILKKSPLIRTPEENEKLRAAGIELTSRKFAAPSYSSGIDEVLAAEKARTPTAMTAQQMEAAMQAAPVAAPRPPGATRPGTGLPRPQNRPQAAPATPLQQLGSAVEQTGTPAPDRLAELEADERARVEGLQKLLASQAQVDPRIVAARKEAAELAQRGIGEREKRAAGALEAAGMPLSQSLFDNQEALFRMLGAMKGGKRIGDAFSSIGQEAGAIRGEQRRALELVQRENRAEQNALDQLRQAQADLKLAQTTGDVQGERNAALKVEEAKANLGLTRLNIQKERATEADRAEQRRLTARGQDLQRLSAQEQIAATLKAASMRGSGELTESQKANLREKATDNVRQDKNLPLLLQNAKIEAQKTGRPFDQQKFIDTLIQREYNRIVGKETPAAPAAGGIDPDILKLFKVTPVGG